MAQARSFRSQRAAVVAGFVLAVQPLAVAAEPHGDLTLARQVRELAGPLAAEKLFFGVVLIGRTDGGRALESFGLADVESNRPVTPKTRFCIASITKPMTQLVFAQLLSDGKVRGDDLVSKHLPGFPKGPSGVEATVDMLLQHRAGVPHRVTKPSEESERWTPERIVSRVAQTGLQFDPGSKRSYTSAGYTCLARIAEVVEGKAFGQILRDRVFATAGMDNAVDPAPREVVPLAARDYLYTLGASGEPLLERAQPRDYAFLSGAGSVWATAEDLARFVHALRSGKFGPGAFEGLSSRQTGDWIGWDGLTGGFASNLAIHRDSGTVVICLSNLRNGAFLELTGRLQELVATGTAQPVRLPPDRVVDDRLLAELSGAYGLGDEVYTLEQSGTGALFQDSYVYPIAGGRLYWPYWYAELRPVRAEDGRVTGLEGVMGDRTMRYDRK